MSLRHGLATALLGPLLLLQGRDVRRRVPVLPEPSGPREGQAGAGKPLRLLILGDSAAAGVGASHQGEALAGRMVAELAPRYRLDWRLMARTGATTLDVLAALVREPAAHFDVVLTSLGVNDVTGRVGLGPWRRQQAQLVERLRAHFGATHILLSGLPPMHRFPALPQPLRWYVGSRARDFDHTLAALAGEREGCEFLAFEHEMMDISAMASDGFHPGPPIYRQWAAEAAKRIARRLEPTT